MKNGKPFLKAENPKISRSHPFGRTSNSRGVSGADSKGAGMNHADDRSFGCGPLFLPASSRPLIPQLRGKPVAVGGRKARHYRFGFLRGAEVWGVYTPMPTMRARKLCPEADRSAG